MRLIAALSLICILVGTYVFDTEASGHRNGIFGPWEVDGGGNVVFRYTGRFNRIYTTTNLLRLNITAAEYAPNPMAWDQQDLGCQGRWCFRKILVPRRYQIQHRLVYGFPLERALYLSARY